ncbi:hypothetical protein BKI52_17670 [marine bacterium AO1-C]|nr:hypothetical protein BKI52_17670 [marine bacterium AO1-C]
MAYSYTYLVRTCISILTIVFYNACSSSKPHSAIDELNNAKDIEAFVHGLNPRHKYFTVNQSLYFEHSGCRKIVQKLKIKPWYKSDVDGNGYNDLIIHSRWEQTNYVAVLMGFPENNYTLKLISDEGCNCAHPLKTSTNNLIEFFHFDDLKMISQQTPTNVSDNCRDTLVYKFGEVIEYQSTSTTQEIEWLNFKTISCLGYCPIFEININKDRTATYHAIKDVLRKGRFKAKLDKKKFQEVMGLLQYIQVNKLENEYQKEGLTAPATELTIAFKNGIIKRIKDANYQSTRGLNHLYNLLIDLRKNQQWEKIK